MSLITCILLGFSYINCNMDDRPELPGIIIDLYLAYKKCLEIKPDKLIIITDITEDIPTQMVRDEIFNGRIQSNILTFIDSIKKTENYIQYTTKSNLIDLLNKLVIDSKYLLIYYTGHLLNKQILLPTQNNGITLINKISNNDNLDLSYFRDIFISNNNIDSNIVFIMDCCNFDGMDLTYILKDNVYRLNYSDNIIYSNKDIICIASTYNIETSYATKNGSIFTKFFLKLIMKDNIINNHKLRDLNYISNLISEKYKNEYDQTVCIYSSYPNLKILPRWLIDGKKINVKIEDNIIKVYY